MAKQKKQRGTGKRSAKKVSVLDRLKPEEAQSVLQRLLAAHRELRSEAQQIAKSLLSEVAFERVADEVEEAVCDLGLDELGSRAGKHSWGYTSPTEAAWELLEERVSPFIKDMKRQFELALDVEALETCKGIVLGLYRARNEQGDDVLQWAPDFPAETAAHAVTTWRDGSDRCSIAMFPSQGWPCSTPVVRRAPEVTAGVTRLRQTSRRRISSPP